MMNTVAILTAAHAEFVEEIETNVVYSKNEIKSGNEDLRLSRKK